MNLSPLQIDSWIYSCQAPKSTNSIVEFSMPDLYKQQSADNLIMLFLVHMAVEIEKHNLKMRYLFVHPCVMRIIKLYLGRDICYLNDCNEEIHIIWGCQIITNSNMPNDILIGLDNNYFGHDTSNIVLGKLDVKMLDRISQLKSFW